MRLIFVFIFQRLHDGKYNAFNVVHNIAIPKADDLVTKRLQIPCSFLVIFFLLQMLTSIEFDDELGFGGAKIWNIFSNGVLPSEIDAKFIPAQVRPELSFSGRGFLAEFARAVHDGRRASTRTRHLPLPALPKCDEEHAEFGEG